MNPTGHVLIDRLYQSIEGLERAVEAAGISLEEKAKNGAQDIHPILYRLDEYRSIISKQKQKVQELCIALQNQDFHEVTRLVTVINGISQMIRDDAREILANLAGVPKEEKLLH